MNLKKCNCSVKLENVFVKDKDHVVINSVSFQVNHGEILALIGKNGSGKTTILKTILNRIPYFGNILFFNSSGKQIKNPRIGYIPQELNFEKSTPLTVLEFFASSMSNFPIWLGVNNKLSSQIFNILTKFGIEYLMNKMIGDLSGGELQRVLLAFALHPTPDILILDEPSSALDNRGVNFFYSLIVKMRKEFHMPVLIVSHDLVQIRKNATKYALIDHGKILEIDNISNLELSKNVKNIFGI